MNHNDKSPHSTMVFTLQDSNEPAQRWEQDLQQLQQRQHQHQAFSVADTPSDTAPAWQNASAPERFGDEELDLAYREYLRHREAEHNQRVQQAAQGEDVAVLLQEDWLAAQSALKTENNRRYLHVQQTVVMQQNQPLQTVEQHETPAGQPYLPPCTVHVYDLPNLPSTRRIRILSEQELINRIQEKLQIHLSNAMAGLVRQAVQKKLATLTYDLQLMLNEETEKVVRDVLEHNLAAVFRSVKDAMR